MFKEVNSDTLVNIGNLHGRVVIHAVSELMADLLPSFNYNSTTHRFIRGQSFVENPLRDSMPRNVPSYFWYGRSYRDAFERANALTRGMCIHCFYVTHFVSMFVWMNEWMDEWDVWMCVCVCICMF